MRPTIAVLTLALLASLGMNANQFVQAEKNLRPQEMPKDYTKNDALQKAKGKIHEKMAKRVGKWKATTKYSQMFGGGKETATTTLKLILGGKFLVGEGVGTYMGAPSHTFGVYGYDNLTKEYTALNLNDTYTAFYEMRGRMRKDGVIEYKGMMKDAMSPKGRPYRVEEYDHGDDKFEFFVYDSPMGSEAKILTLTYERIK